tara:strand:+ start:3222 stop:4070 length:849 start_codon:yes stop_codon:yes gene_type:complete
MKPITVVTTFHKPGLDLYGQRFLDSFAKEIDDNVKLIVYAEDCEPINPNSEQITILNSKEVLPKLNAFKDRWKDVPKANGICPFPERRPRDHHKKFKWDAIRFANKTYAVFDGVERAKQNGSDWVVWMDADIFVHSIVTYDKFKELLPDNKYITYVGRGKGSQTWPECGFYGFNLNHPVAYEFLKEFERMYEDADNGMFTLDEWHDSYVFGEVLKKYKEFNAEHDYSESIYVRTAKTGGGGHPFINSILGDYFDHMKGVRKEEGKSRAKDLMQGRAEQYWQG